MAAEEDPGRQLSPLAAALIEEYRAAIAERVAADRQAYRETVDTWVRDSVARFVRFTDDTQWMVQFLSAKALELRIPFDVSGLVNAIAPEAFAAEQRRRQAEALEADNQSKAIHAKITMEASARAQVVEKRVYKLALRGFISAESVEIDAVGVGGLHLDDDAAARCRPESVVT